MTTVRPAPASAEPPGDRTVDVSRIEWRGNERRDGVDRVVREEPLEIQVGSFPVAVVMRTPGDDLDLAAGFLVTEGVVSGPEDLLRIDHCDVVPSPEAEDNVVRAVLAPGVRFDPDALRRHLYAASSCGICGKATIAQALARAAPLTDAERGQPHSRGWLRALPGRLRAAQPVFEATGGLHAAALFRPGETDPQVAREDVGRHNAVDKVVGWAVRSGGGLPRGGVLVVSGRVSWEIVQKALAARIPLVAAVSAPSSLAIRLAAEAGITVAAFLRGDRFCAYGASRAWVD